jgi:flagellin
VRKSHHIKETIVAFSINTNVASLQAQQYLNINSAFQNQTIEEVTSGLRIVNSGDDAAGLAVANGYRADEAVLTQGIQNANNGLSQLQIIDGGMDNISQLLDRASTLATESASGTFTGDRNVLNSEFQSVLGEINRQSQAIGLNTGGTFAKNLSVFIGGGQGPTGEAAIQNGTVSLNLAQSTIDTKSLGLEGVQASGVAGTDISPGSATTSVADILANPANTTTSSGYTDFYISGPGFSNSNKIQVQVNLSEVTDAGTLVTAVNDAIQNAGNATTQYATAFRNANITASIVTDAQGREQLSFSSSNTAFQVQAGDEMANALMGNFGAKAVMTGNTTGAFGALADTDFLQLSFNGGPMMNFYMAGGETDAADVAATLDQNPAFTANAVAGTTSSGALTITSVNDASGSTISVGNSAAATALGLTGTATVSPTTGKSLVETVTSTLGTASTGNTLDGTIVRIQGGGLASPVDISLGAGDTSQALGVADLVNQVNTNSTLQAAGISASSANGQLVFSSNSGQSFNVSAVGDTTNELGLGNYLANGGAFDYNSIVAANPIVTGATADMLEISVGGGPAQQISVTGTAGDTAQNLADSLNTALNMNATTHAAGIVAYVAENGNLALASGNGTNFRVAEGTGTAANQVLGFAADALTNTLTTGAYTGGGGTAIAGDAGSWATIPTSGTNDIYFDAGGSAATSVFQFNPIVNAQDDQTITISANDSSGTAHSLAIVLSNNSTASNASSLDQAITTINAQLQESDDSTLSQIVAVKNVITNANGIVTGEGIQFISALQSFSVTPSAAGTGSVVGIGSASQQGTVQSSALLAGGGSADISNQSSAEAAVTALGQAVVLLGAAQAVVGRGENQFTYAVNLAQSQLTNTAAAESSIRDADMAAEAANLTKAQILIQAGVAALAQANSAPEQVLTLLKQ